MFDPDRPFWLVENAPSLDALLRTRAELHGPRTAYTYLDYVGPPKTLTYQELDARARSIAAHLQEHGAYGERVLLIFPQGLDFVAAFFGCLYAGAIAVPAYPPRRNQKATRIETILADCQARFALCDRDTLDGLQARFDDWPHLAGLSWMAVEDIATPPDIWREPPQDPQRPAFLQFTSGSTGDPKGVIVTHANILSNQAHIGRAFQQRAGFNCGGWLPMYHDMGLIGNTLHPLCWGGNLTFMSPVAFLQQPIRWLRMISDYRVSISGAPNFAYQLCVDETTEEQRQGLDLSCWEVAYNGSEPIHPKTMRRFAEVFAPHGFSADALCPCYGMAETTLLVSGAHPRERIITCHVDAQALSQGRIEPLDDAATNGNESDERKAVELVACGAPDPDFDIQIVDPETHRPCPPNQVGEIWLAGPSVTAGYWGRPEITAAQFAATLANESDPASARRYLRTGDLGFLRDGQLYITGRLKDLLIVRGANHYPQDIERTVAASHPGLAADAGAVFALPGIDGGPERVVAVNELKREYVRAANHDEIFAAIRQAVAAEHELNLETIVLLRTVSIPKTSSGKIQRSLTRQRFEANDLKVVARWDRSANEPALDTVDVEAAAEPSSSLQPVDRATLSHDQRQQIAALERWMIERLAARLRLAPHQIHPRQPFASLGVDSLTAVRLAGELEEHLGRSVPPTVAWDHRHVAGLAYYLVTGQSEEASAATIAAGDPQAPLAVVGIGCRFPGADSADAFWDLLRRGECAVGQQPRDRWGAALHAAAQRSGRPLPDRGGYLDGVDLFDPGFFGISPREAAEMDPQQRLLLETTWEALEHAGISPDRLAGTRGGVFIGVSGGDYARLQAAAWHTPGGHTATGGSLAIVASRLSYHFDLRGPCLTIDTACSSSLVAVHQAVVSLRRGECDFAVAGGVSLILAPDTTASFNCQSGMLSPRGLCQAFAADADGFVRGEGCGVVVLKRLSQATADGDRIVAVIRGSAVNQDGRSNGLTAPNGLAQQQVIRSALADGNIEPQAVDYVEAHGTGTPLGDPIEMGAIGAVYGQQRKNRLTVGSVKTNVGHLEGAAGIAGLIKTCLTLYHGHIPPHLHFDRPSPHIDWSRPIEIPVAGKDWPRDEQRPRLAAVSSFGFGGTNAHVVLEEAPVSTCHGVVSRAPGLLILSAKTATALKTLASRYDEYLASTPDEAWADVCATAAIGRAALQHRLALVAEDAAHARGLLASYTADQPTSAVVQGAPASTPAVAWLFTGQGHSPFGAAKRWYETYAGFRRHLDQVAEVLANYWPLPVKQLLWEDGPWQQSTDVQPALFALQYAWAAWWQELGIQPQAVVGHSLGEYAAACIAGVFSLDDAAKLVTCRAKLIGQLREAGGMLAVAASTEQLEPYLADADRLRISLAAINGPRQTVLAGADAGLNALADRLTAAGISSKRLATTHAFHSPLLDDVLDAFDATAQTVQYQRPQLAYLSALLGDWDSEQVATPGYWRRQLREPVRFATALSKLPDQATVWAEIGPGNVLSRLAKQQQTSSDQPLTILSGWPDAASEERYLLEQLGRLWTAGVPIDWQAFYSQQPRPVRRVTLPSYPFERKRYWFTTNTIEVPKADIITADATLPGRRLDLAGDAIVFETDLAAHSYLADHVVAGSAVFPAAGYLALALAAAAEVEPQRNLELTDVQFLCPLAFTPGESCRVQTVLTPSADNGTYQVQFARREADRWRRYATAVLQPADVEATNGAPLPEPTGQAIDPAEHYRRCQQVGLAYGPAFQGVQKLVRLPNGSAWGQVRLPATLYADDTTSNTLHPALLDACFQVAAAAFDEAHAGAWLPVAVHKLRFVSTPAADELLHVAAQLEPTDDPQRMHVHLKIVTATGHTVAAIEGLTVQQTAAASQPRTASTHHEQSQTAEPQATPEWLPQPATSPEQYVLTGPPETLSDRLLEYLSLRIVDVTDLRPEEIDADRPLDSLGLDSLMAFQLRDELLEKLRLDVPLEMFLQNLTLREMAFRLADSLAASNIHDSQAMAEEAWVEGAL